MRCMTNARCTTGGAGGNRGFSAMMLVERHRNGIAKVCDVRKHGIRLFPEGKAWVRSAGNAVPASLHNKPVKKIPETNVSGIFALYG